MQEMGIRKMIDRKTMETIAEMIHTNRITTPDMKTKAEILAIETKEESHIIGGES